MRAGPVTAFAAAMVLTAVASTVLPTMTNVLGLLVVLAALFVTPPVTAALGGLAVGLAVVHAALIADTTAWLRVVNVVVASALGVAISMILVRRERGLAAARRREADVLAAMPEGVAVLDDSGALVRANAGLLRLVPAARVGEPLHPLVGHILADGTPCPGGCALAGVRPEPPSSAPREGERITCAGTPLPVAYTVGRYGRDAIVVTVRDVSARVAAQQDREVLLQAAARSEEQATMLRALAGPRRSLTPTGDVLVDSWSPSDAAGQTIGHLSSMTVLPDGRCLLLMVGSDGRGYESARDAWKVLYVARAHVAAGSPLAEMVSRAADSLAEDGDSPTATIVGAILDPVTGYLQVASGGHSPPLLVRSDGSSSWVDAPGRPLGGNDPRSVRVASSLMGPGDSLFVYGGGIIDATNDVVEGMSALRSAAVALRHSALVGLAERVGRTVTNSSAAPDRAAMLVVLRLAGAEPAIT